MGNYPPKTLDLTNKSLAHATFFRPISPVQSLSDSDVAVPKTEKDMGGCQNYGPFLVPHYDTAPNI